VLLCTLLVELPDRAVTAELLAVPVLPLLPPVLCVVTDEVTTLFVEAEMPVLAGAPVVTNEVLPAVPVGLTMVATLAVEVAAVGADDDVEPTPPPPSTRDSVCDDPQPPVVASPARRHTRLTWVDKRMGAFVPRAAAVSRSPP
jgi:hypothetical protein